MGSLASGVPIGGELILADAMKDLRGKLGRDVYNAWLQGVVAGAEATAITALATAKTTTAVGVAAAPETAGVGAVAGLGLSGAALVVAANAQAIVAMAAADYGRGGAVGQHYESGKQREAKVQAELEREHPKASVQREQYLRDKNGRIVKDPKTGKARRVDHAVIEGKKAKTYETTSETASKTEQSSRERRILKSGGGFVRDRRSREVVPVEGESTVIRRP